MARSAFAIAVILLLCAIASPARLIFSVATTQYGSTTFYPNVDAVKQTAWKPIPARTLSAHSDRKGILFLGDVLLARNVEALVNRNNPAYPFQGLDLKKLAPDSYILGNFEGSIPLIHTQTPALQVRFSVGKNLVLAAEEAGFSHFSLANNHSFDFGSEGLDNTRNEIHSANLVSFGDPNEFSEPLSVTYVSVEKKIIAIVGLHAIDTAPSREQIDSLMASVQSASDIQILVVHWGTEYAATSNINQQTLAGMFANAGVDLIIGHHPHVVQEIGLVNGVPVVYSLGNYVFDQYFSNDVMEGLAINLSLGDDPQLLLYPVESRSKLSQPRLMEALSQKRFLNNLALKSDPDLQEAIKQGALPLRKMVATSTKIAMMGTDNTNIYVQ